MYIHLQIERLVISYWIKQKLGCHFIDYFVKILGVLSHTSSLRLLLDFFFCRIVLTSNSTFSECVKQALFASVQQKIFFYEFINLWCSMRFCFKWVLRNYSYLVVGEASKHFPATHQPPIDHSSTKSSTSHRPVTQKKHLFAFMKQYCQFHKNVCFICIKSLFFFYRDM